MKYVYNNYEITLFIKTYSNLIMNNKLLQNYLNITKLLELTPNTTDYNKQRQLMNEDEISVVKQLKQKQALKKHRTLKKYVSKVIDNNNDITIDTYNEAINDIPHMDDITEIEVVNEITIETKNITENDEDTTLKGTLVTKKKKKRKKKQNK